ncbi:MAG TPA: substrate-binding domain-containing protein [Candidatus Dormibacteraeota bacterium]|nr:substrate-binding domain-containing protein [Candidatus Dormibacteraeota bacterium]
MRVQVGRVKRLAGAACASAVAVVLAACGGSSSSSGGTATVPSGLTVKSFDSSFAAMDQLKDLTKAGKGLVGVILPDTTSSTRYVNFDDPYLRKAFQSAGYASSDFKIDNAQGNDATELADAQADISLGAKVLVFDPLDATVGSQIQAYAQSHGVKTISYDRATFTGNNVYYVSFDNVQVGKLIGQGFMDCVTAWNVQSPKVFVLNGGQDVDPNAVSFAQGYNSVIWGNDTTPQKAGATNSKGYTLVGDQVTPGWVNATGGTIFQQQFTAHPNINATVEANDGLANAVITVLKNSGVAAKKIPTTGQDATLQGMTNILQGFQCGSVYKPIYAEAQAAVALATILRAGQTPPSSLVNGTTSPPSNVSGTKQPASLLTPMWVDAANMGQTVIKDKFVSASALCAAVGASVCAANNIPTS